MAWHNINVISDVTLTLAMTTLVDPMPGVKLKATVPDAAAIKVHKMLPVLRFSTLSVT